MTWYDTIAPYTEPEYKFTYPGLPQAPVPLVTRPEPTKPEAESSGLWGGLATVALIIFAFWLFGSH